MGSANGDTAAQPDTLDPHVDVSGVEATVVGLQSRREVDRWVSDALEQLLGERVRSVLFRSGRIDAVYGLETEPGRRVLLKVHRAPVDLAGRRLVVRAQEVLAEAGFPCAQPLAGPGTVDGKVISVETLLPEGERADGHDRNVRRSVADTLAEQVSLLGDHPDLVAAIGHPPAWCYYEQGAWGFTHDSAFDFSTTPPEYAWPQQFAQDAADELNASRDPDAPRVAAHADWYCGNLRFDGSRLIAAFDWDLFADSEPVVAGITAGMFSSGTSAIAGPPTAQEVGGFMHDYERARGIRFDTAERALAQAAARWSVAYTARCDVTQAHGGPARAGSALDRLTTSTRDYFDLDW